MAWYAVRCVFRHKQAGGYEEKNLALTGRERIDECLQAIGFAFLSQLPILMGKFQPG